MSDDEKKAIIHISDVLGLSKGAEHLVKAIVRGVGNLFAPWQTKRMHNADIAGFKSWTAALKKVGLAPTAAELSLDERATVRVAAQEIRRQENREAIAVESIREYKTSVENEPSTSFEGILDVEWIDRFWRLAQDVTDADMQAVWGRVLARQARGANNYSPRSLETLSLLSRQEAKHLEEMATLLWTATAHGKPDNYILISVQQLGTPLPDHLHDGVPKAAGELHRGIFGPAGITADSGSGWAHSAHVDILNNEATITISRAIFVLKFPTVKNGPHYIGSGLAITPLGAEIFSLITTEPRPFYIEALKTSFSHYGVELQRM